MFFRVNKPETDAWYVKPFWRKVWSMNGVGLGSLGATTIYGEYGRYNDQFAAGQLAAIAGRDRRRCAATLRPREQLLQLVFTCHNLDRTKFRRTVEACS